MASTHYCSPKFHDNVHNANINIHSNEHTDIHNADGWDDGEHDGWLGERPRGDDGGLGTGCGQQSGSCHDDDGGEDYDG